MPSRIESLGYVMLEAGLAKKPFIGGRTGGIEEFIEDGVDGLLVEPGNVEDLYLKMLYLINDANLQKKMGENLYKKVLPLTNKEAYIQQLVSLYEKLLHTNN
jgi:glycosyltransferase involved in cell wall biosynthesis